MSIDIRTGRDCINAALRFSGELTDVGIQASEYRESALYYMNRIYKAIMSGSNEFEIEMDEPFSWARSPQSGVITLEPSVSVGMTLTSGDINGVFSVIPTVSYEGWWIKLDGWEDMFRIVDHNAGQTNFQIDSPWTDDTGTYTVGLYKTDYETVPMLRLIGPLRMYQSQAYFDSGAGSNNGEIPLSDMAAMLREFPRNLVTIKGPTRCSIKEHDPETNVMTLTFNSVAQDTARVEYDYIPYPALLNDDDLSIPLMPLSHRIVLAYGVAHYICVDKNDDRAGTNLQKLQAGLKSMILAEQSQRNISNPYRARLIPRLDKLNRYTRRWRGFF